MKILVSGGTGFLGSAIVQKLKEAGHSVFILSRKAVGPDIIRGDITKPETLPRALEGMEAVVQCAQFPGHPIENRKKGYTYWQVDALGTENLSKFLKPAGIRQILYISGAGTDGKRSEPWFKAKWYAEQAVHASGVQTAILRPSWIYGPKDKSLNRILGQARYLPFLPMIGNGKNRIQPLFINDLAEIVSLCLFPYLVGES
ncbi:MAG: NAD-dependent epimerase/dehydratase family protein, partial [Deltaproteobacteria bacterium]|nr:NAD-dependent epimerase/dehydratase family protein [Deltaproteobacteria bacterium]